MWVAVPHAVPDQQEVLLSTFILAVLVLLGFLSFFLNIFQNIIIFYCVLIFVLILGSSLFSDICIINIFLHYGLLSHSLIVSFEEQNNLILIPSIQYFLFLLGFCILFKKSLLISVIKIFSHVILLLETSGFILCIYISSTLQINFCVSLKVEFQLHYFPYKWPNIII